MNINIEKIDAFNPDIGLLEKAARHITQGEVLVCPTDTGYAFCTNALNSKAVAKVFGLKGRSYSNPIHIAVGSIKEGEKYAHVNVTARYLADHFLPGALTLVLPKKDTIPSMLVAGLDTVGIRIPDNKVILALAEMTGLPLTTTSANISGKPTPYTVEEWTGQQGETTANIAMILDQGPLSIRELSTIVDLAATPPQLIRQGRVSWFDIREALKLIKSSD
ncbi:L-threonylcarbamoyladenylate synthase [Chloroflexota bacterium]